MYRAKVERLHLALADPGLRDEALGILRGLIERVVVHPAEDGLQVEIVGEIVRMVAGPGHETGCAPGGGGLFGQGGTGEGFEPTTQGL